MHLDSSTHRVALDQHEQTTDAPLHELTLLPGGPARIQEFDRLTNLLCLHKVHRVCREELEGEESTQCDAPHYPNAELGDLPA